jgi:hypothetical protein
MPGLPRTARWIAQALLYAAFAAVVGVFSYWPDFRVLQPDEGLIAVSIAHHGERMQPCEELSAESLARLPPNMRAPTRCPRERAPLLLEVDIDGLTVLQQWARPSGLSRDGAASFYRRMPLAAGQHRIEVRLRDSPRSAGFDHVREAVVALRPAQILVVDFDSERREITLR